MSVLAQYIAPRGTFLRSTNLERDSGGGRVADYTPTARSLDLLRRVMDGWGGGPAIRSRAWSVVGPYGSGKSSFALLLDALLAPMGSIEHQSAIAAINGIDSALGAAVESAHLACGTQDRGFVRAFVTADPEPATTSVLRAAQRGIARYWPRGRKPAVAAAIDAALEEAAGGKLITPSRLVALLREVSRHAPVMVVIDEFGKNLEFLRAAGADGDLYVMQALAEAAVGGEPPGLGVMAIQHMTFDDYSATASVEQRREWAKIQGRFEEILFLDSADQTLALMSHVFEANWPRAERRRLEAWASAGNESLRKLGLSDRISDAWQLARMFPLHPVSAAVLPDLCRRYGQNERTLFSFLTHDEPGAAGEFLRKTRLPQRGDLPTVRLPALFDYFIGSVTPSLGASPESARWFEIHDRISQAIGLTDTEEEVLKTVGILNLIAQGGSLRASREVVSYALRPAPWIRGESDVHDALTELERRGFLTYRSFADEYRLWQGSDFDLEGRLEIARRNYSEEPTSVLLAKVAPLSPVVASRHAQEKGVVRTFARCVIDGASAIEDLIAEDEESDGFIIYLRDRGDLSAGKVDRPIVLLEVPDLVSLRELLIEASAAVDVVVAGDIDWVARREMEERVAQAFQKVRDALDRVLTASHRPTLLVAGKARQLPAVKSAAEVASLAADEAYFAAPDVRNEMLGRNLLTSQAARARLDLMTAMLASPHEERLGIEGYGPERALYEAILSRPGFHRFDGERWEFGPPPAGSSFEPAWQIIDELLRGAEGGELIGTAAIEAALRRPPVGVKAPLVPILLTAYLQSLPDQTAIYQDGTFQPRLSPDLMERLTKAPARFAVRHMTVEGQRADVLRALARKFDLVIRSSSSRQAAPVLSVVGPLLETIRQLPDYTLHAAELSDTASAVRSTLLSAREPDQLLFAELPTALGLRNFGAKAADSPDPDEYASLLHGALREISGAFPALQAEISEHVARGLSLHHANALKAEAAARARPLLTQVADARLRALLFALSSDALDDEDWVDAVGLAISERPPKMWREDDVVRFPSAAKALLGAFRRVEALHFELRATSAEGFIARRVTVTRPDGAECSRVVWVDEADVDRIRELLRRAGPSLSAGDAEASEDLLLAAMAELLLPSDTTGQEESKVADMSGEEQANGR